MSRPTNARPGTEAKIDVIAARYEAGQDLWHPGDATLEDMVMGSQEFLDQMGLGEEDRDEDEPFD